MAKKLEQPGSIAVSPTADEFNRPGTAPVSRWQQIRNKTTLADILVGLHAPTSPGATQGSDCSIVVEAGPNGFSIPDGFKPNQGLFLCSPDTLVKLKGDYGKGVTLDDVGKSLSDLK